MRTWPVVVGLCLGFGPGGNATAAPAADLEVEVIARDGRWSADGRHIVTDVTVRAADGTTQVVLEWGGTVDGVGQREFHGPAPLRVGDRVRLHMGSRQTAGGLTVKTVERWQSLRADFVQTGPTEGGNLLAWAGGCVFVHYDPRGTADVAGEGEFAALDASIDEWNGRVQACSYLQILLGPRQTTEVGRDFVNVIKFRDTTWCRPATDDLPERCHSPNAAAVTTVTFINDGSSRDGEIVDADIEFNAVNFAAAVNGQSLGSECAADVANTITHELGHLLGLEHTCILGGDPPRVDHLGNDVPACGTADDPAITDATMFATQECGETSKASLSADEVTAICTIYPVADDPGVCEPVEVSGCCAVSGRANTPVGPVSLATLTGLLLLRRRRQRRPQ